MGRATRRARSSRVLPRHILIATPGRSTGGNATTARRWASLFEGLGHRVSWAGEASLSGADVLVALHARHSAAVIRAFRAAHVRRPVIVALTGTDLYGYLPADERASRSLALGDRFVVLQPLALERLPSGLHERTRVILQSGEPLLERPARSTKACVVSVVAHLRAVKDPLRAAHASRLLPASSRIRVQCVGKALEPSLQAEAEEEARTNPRFDWLGERTAQDALALLVGSHALVVSSRLEGGANVITEAIVNRVPVLASDVPGNVGLLGRDHPGLFAPGDTSVLAALLNRLEADPAFLPALELAAEPLRPLFAPERERQAWKALLEEL